MARGRKPKSVTASKDPITDGLTFGKKSTEVNEQFKAMVGGDETTPEIKSTVPDVPVTVSGVNLKSVIEEILYWAYLGAVPKPKVFPMLTYPPYKVELLVTEEAADNFKKQEGKRTWQEGTEYYQVLVNTPDPVIFLRELVRLGEKGAVIAPNVGVKIGKPHQVNLSMRVIEETSPVVRTLPKKQIIYSEKELAEMKLSELQSIGKVYDVTGRSKKVLIKGILNGQEGV